MDLPKLCIVSTRYKWTLPVVWYAILSLEFWQYWVNIILDMKIHKMRFKSFQVAMKSLPTPRKNAFINLYIEFSILKTSSFFHIEITGFLVLDFEGWILISSIDSFYKQIRCWWSNNSEWTWNGFEAVLVLIPFSHFWPNISSNAIWIKDRKEITVIILKTLFKQQCNVRFFYCQVSEK